MRFEKIVFALSVGALSLSFALSPAMAHAKLLQSTPAADSTVAAPKTIKLTFSEKLVPAFSGISLSMGDGMVVSTKASLSDDGKTMSARPTSPFMAGKWTLSWHATSVDDGHKSEGSLTFTVK